MLSGGGVKYVKANETLTFEARKAEIVAIVGESGCGKSTFAKVLMGLETATEGTITFNGEKIESTEVQQRPREQVASLQMVFQNPNDTLNPSMTVGGQISGVIRRFGVESDAAKVRERVMRLLDMRSEEHTSELQSLMRISYAVFCLQKKTHKNLHKH